MRLSIVDVFAETPLAGNQLAVVRDAASLSTERMQAIAREMNFSETTFVLDESVDRARVRIFTPTDELPFAGHPTLGTAWVLGREREQFTLDLPAGPIAVTFGQGSSAEDAGICWMTPPQPEFAAAPESSSAAALVGLSEAELHDAYLPTLLAIGPEFILIGVQDEAVLARARLNLQVRQDLLDAGYAARSAFVFCPGTTTDYSARMFFNVNGVREDPATGSANSGFAVYLRDVCGRPPGRYVVAQGDQIGRPSRIYLELGAASYRVGGRVQAVATGELSPLL